MREIKLPNKFEFKKYSGEKYIMAKVDGEYYCYDIGEELSEPNRSQWRADMIMENLTGKSAWTITKDLDEPELVFPFTYYHVDASGDGGQVTPSKTENYVNVKCLDGSFNNDFFTVTDVKRYIKEGLWIITSVGEQKPVEVPASHINSVKLGVGSVDIKEATAALKELAEAIEEVNTALERMRSLFKGK